MSQIPPGRPLELSEQSHATPVYDKLPKTGRYIRRLHLQPGDASTRLACHLETVSLKNYPVYEALSYCWGSDSNNVHEISCNGSGVTITQNLQDALQDLRAPDKVRITQFGEPRLESSCKLLGRPWFERAWVRQEVILAQEVDVSIGSTTFPWSLLAEAVRRIYWVQNDVSILQSHFRLAYNLQQKKTKFPKLESQSLLKIIWDDFTSEASDPRDRVFAYVSIAKDESPVFEIDYSLSTAQVYTRFTLHCLRTNQNMEALDAVKDPEFTWTVIPPIEEDWIPQAIKVPSWVNDWNRQIGDRTQILNLISGVSMLRATAP